MVEVNEQKTMNGKFHKIRGLLVLSSVEIIFKEGLTGDILECNDLFKQKGLHLSSCCSIID